MQQSYPPQNEDYRVSVPPSDDQPSLWAQKSELNRQLRLVISGAAPYCSIGVLAGLVNALGALEEDQKATPPDVQYVASKVW